MVPSQYFDDEFVFNFEYLTQDKAKVFDIQEKVIMALIFSAY